MLDGLGAEAGQALGVQSPDPGRPGDELCLAERRPGGAEGDPVRDHARRRHPVAPRQRAAAGGDSGAPAERAAVRPGARAGRRGVWRLAAAGELSPGGGHAFAVRRAAGGVGGNRPLLDGRLRFLHGPVRPGQLHRQGDLRPRRLRGGDRQDLPREPDPEPRPDRGELRAVRTGQRYRAVRRLPGAVSRLRPPRAPLGPGRLAAPPLARPLGALRPRAGGATRCRCWNAGSSSTTSAAAWSLPPWSSSWSWAGRSSPARPGSGRPWRCRCRPFRSCR